ncbi:alkaline shock response membrane anchor protein AmaP [Paenibacillus sp. GSMTC-2017]|uniref:alkaline shock response membrane anchor protein AmaP n=1 Tax=Paenibacillus sp. GSMTC-2017 TaxID=2794350 RepID=UPI0018D96B22|nr:alkaline shock response membrane anchor protein AmaP [Paenibacillus sp. GSMTC-2017]MBH5318063.1 alkaline shock response membrane anchor protein AmaP [Paenibacillus sp. GSMTC-2017]
MIKVVDKLLLFLYSIVIGIISVVIICLGFGWVSAYNIVDVLDDYFSRDSLSFTSGVLGCVLLLISVRLVVVSVQRSSISAQSIDQRTEFGDIRISIETIENLALKTAVKQRGVKDIKARVRANDAGLEIVLRAIIDGEHSIPTLTEEIQRAVKEHIEEITGIPVTNVAVFVANVIQANTFKSRVE